MFEKVIYIAGVPRSGTSWLGQIVDSSPNVRYRFQPLFSYEFKDYLSSNSSPEKYEQFLRKIYSSENDFLVQKERRKKGKYPNFSNKKSRPSFLSIKMVRYHYLLPYFLKHVDCLKLIPIIRHPCGVINSWITTPEEFPSEADPMEDWRKGKCRNQGQKEEYWGFEAWKEATELFLGLENKYAERVNIVHYEDLVEHPVSQTKSLFNFLNLDYTDQTQSFLERCHQKNINDSHAVFKSKGVKDKWRSELPEKIKTEILNDLNGTKFEKFL